MKKKFLIPLGVLVLLSIGIAMALSINNIKNVETVFALAPEDTPAWDFQGVYKGDTVLEERAQTDIEKLKAMEGNDIATRYDIQIGLAQQYEMLGDGKTAYNHLLNAIKIDDKRSLAYANLGVLLGRVGARESAKIAYERALDRDDNVINRINYIQHLEQYFGDDLDLVESAHTFAIEKFPGSVVLKERYEAWKKVHGR